MAADLAAFRSQFPEFKVADYDDVIVNRVLTEAKILHSIQELATLYCAAHILVLEQEKYDEQGNLKLAPDGGSGVVSKETIGPRTIEYVTQAGDPQDRHSRRRAFFAGTVYGRFFLELEARTPRYGIGAMVV